MCIYILVYIYVCLYMCICICIYIYIYMGKITPSGKTHHLRGKRKPLTEKRGSAAAASAFRAASACSEAGSYSKAHRHLCHPPLGVRVIKKKTQPVEPLSHTQPASAFRVASACAPGKPVRGWGFVVRPKKRFSGALLRLV